MQLAQVLLHRSRKGLSCTPDFWRFLGGETEGLLQHLVVAIGGKSKLLRGAEPRRHRYTFAGDPQHLRMPHWRF